MKQMISDEQPDVIIFKKFLVQLIRNYLFGGSVAVLGVGSILIFSTLQLSSIEFFGWRFYSSFRCSSCSAVNGSLSSGTLSLYALFFT